MLRSYRIILSSALFGFAAAGGALAQDGAQSPWNGAYGGIGAGIGAMKLRQTGDVTPLLGFVATIDNAGDGAFGTAQIGYDISLNRWLVVGAFTDFDLGSVRSVPLVDVGAPALNDTITWRRSWNVGGRIGLAPSQRMLWYVPFGYTNANVQEHNISINSDQETVSKNLNGWFAGVGVEALVGTNWSTKFEYRYTQLQNSLFYTDAGGNRFFVEPHMHSVRALVSYRFNGYDVPNPQRPIYTKAPPAAPAQPSWTGLYVGAGFGAAAVKFRQTVDLPGVPDTTFSDLGGEGVFGTVQGGADVQLAPQVVAGVFASYDFGDIKSTPATSRCRSSTIRSTFTGPGMWARGLACWRHPTRWSMCPPASRR